MAKKRALFTIDEKLLKEFHKKIPARDRSQTIEALMWSFLENYRDDVPNINPTHCLKKVNEGMKDG